ncbi:ferredoxin [Paenibacillus aurantiacus]|uniref:Ferredoxin n=1 Tax=Paenibacillus aurantiacus TaxID=1936118 RepID=A0ABV5KU66_9BACL
MGTWDLSRTKHHVLICNGGSCSRQQADEVTHAIRAEIAHHAAEDRIHTTRTKCNGRCEDACVVIVYPEGTWYKNMTPESGKQLVSEHLLQGEPLQDQLTYAYHTDRFIPTGQGSKGILRNP